MCFTYSVNMSMYEFMALCFRKGDPHNHHIGVHDLKVLKTPVLNYGGCKKKKKKNL